MSNVNWIHLTFKPIKYGLLDLYCVSFSLLSFSALIKSNSEYNHPLLSSRVDEVKHKKRSVWDFTRQRSRPHPCCFLLDFNWSRMPGIESQLETRRCRSLQRRFLPSS